MTTTTEVPQVTIPNLASEFDMDPRTIRRLIRGLDFRAPRGEDTANRYTWSPDSPDLAKIRATLHTYKNPPPAPEAKPAEPAAPVDHPKAKRATSRKAKAAAGPATAWPLKEVATPDPEAMDLGEEAAEAGNLI